MSKDYIGPFGPEQQAAAVEALDRLYRSGAGISDETIVARVLSAAVGALDREALVEKYEAILKEHGVKATARAVTYGDAHDRYRTNIARDLVEDIFPTEPEVQDG